MAKPSPRGGTETGPAEYLIECDGASSGNPGPAGIGVRILRGEESVAEVSEPIGRATNNEAEYAALIRGLDLALAHGARRVRVRMDSELVVRQVLGEYRARDARMASLRDEAAARFARFESWEIRAVRRGVNAKADALAKAGSLASAAGGPAARRSEGG